jgi:Fur family ferric uptake transcriptional regulator
MIAAQERLREFLKLEGMRKTQERELILEEVMQSEGHFEPEEIFFRLHEKGRDVSRTSVYRTIPLLVKAGIVRKTPCDRMKARYERIFGYEHHDHLICIGCGRIIEFHDDAIEEAQTKVAMEHCFEMTGHRLVISGYCEVCQR